MMLNNAFLVVGVAALLANEFIDSVFGIRYIKSDSASASIGVAVLGALAIAVTSKLSSIQQHLLAVERHNGEIVDVRPSHERVDLTEAFARDAKVRVLTLSGTQTLGIGNDQVRQALEDPDRKCKIELLLGDPFSPAIERRYETDEPDTYEAGVEGIARRLVWLHGVVADLPEKSRRSLEVRVFENYPTVSVTQVDKDMYSTVYGYRLRGSDCPKIHVDRDSVYGRFLIRHFDAVWMQATPLADWFESNKQRLENGGLLRNHAKEGRA